VKELLDVLIQESLTDMDEEALRKYRSAAPAVRETKGSRWYPRSLYRKQGALYCMAMLEGRRLLCAFGKTAFENGFGSKVVREDGWYMQQTAPSPAALSALWELFPFTRPVSLRTKRTTIGMGDRLGRASPGHIHAARKYNLFPVLAQQSLRELDFTGRSYPLVVSDAAFAVLQEGFEKGYGADGDHLKTIDAIDSALETEMPMITLDLTEVMRPEAADWNETRIEEAFAKLEGGFARRVESDYSDKTFRFGSSEIRLSVLEARRCAVMYGPALDFSVQVNNHLKEKRGEQYDLEISIDETTTPTLPSHHVFIASELARRGVSVNSLAPRFVGEFQKAIDYIGDPAEFESQFKVHADIAAANGGYKVSVHSGSDKFSVYPIVGKYTQQRLHLKTAGTSWLEALRVIAKAHPELYRKMHEKAFRYYPEALKQYHITADIEAITPLTSVPDSKLEDYLLDDNARQLLHISYGGLLNDQEIGPAFFKALDEDEDLYYEVLEKHFDKHINLLGIDKLGIDKING
jgi:hypothetical protein